MTSVMTADEWEDFIEQMIADHDTLMIVLKEASQVSEGTVVEHEVTKEDFVRSSR
jgi:hypothetical protein